MEPPARIALTKAVGARVKQSTLMDAPIPPRQETARETPYFAGRLKILAIFGTVFLFILCSRLAYLCVIHGEDYLTASIEQNARHESIAAPRGIISDRNGYPLATNRITYSVFLNPHNLTSDTLSRSIARFRELTGIRPDPSFARRKLPIPRDHKKPLNCPYLSILLAQGLTLETATMVAERQALELPGMNVVETFERTYDTAHSNSPVFSHVLGYISQLSPEDVKREREAGRTVDAERDRIGKLNLEKYYDDLLRGEKGWQNQVYDSHGRAIGEPEVEQAAVSGANLELTLDAELQMRAAELMQPFAREVLDKAGKPQTLGGVLIAMDPRNGEILALVSVPDFDYTGPHEGPQDAFNRAIDGMYAPGSTFKLVTASAALKQDFSPDNCFECGHYWSFYKTRFKCLFSHNSINMYDALRSSCNVYFFELAQMLRWKALADAAQDYGFGQSPNVDLGRGGKTGILQMPRQNQENLVNGDVIQLGIGQGGFIAVSPLQLLSAYAAVANLDGLRMRPHLLRKVIYPDGHLEKPKLQPGQKSPASDRHIREVLNEGFRRVVEMKQGTANKAGFDPRWRVAGKTGSAEWGKDCKAGEENAWFAGYAPYDNPEIAIVVLCEHSGHGGEVAAPVAKQFLETYFRKRHPDWCTAPASDPATSQAAVSASSSSGSAEAAE